MASSHQEPSQSSSPALANHWSRAQKWIAASIVLLAMLLAAPALSNGFTMDDRRAAMPQLDDGKAHVMVGSLQPIQEYFTSHYWRGHKEASPLYRPCTVLSFAICNAASDGSEAKAARLQHALNLVLYGLTVLLAILLVARLGSASLALIAGGAFAAHAIHSEVVGNVVGRAELLAFVAGAVGSICLLSRRLPSWLAICLANLAFFAAFCSKESAIVWPAFAGLAAWAMAAGSGQWGRVVGRSLLAAAPAALVFLWLRHHAIDSADPALFLVNPLAHVDAPTRIASALWVALVALSKLVVPIGLASDYGHAVFDRFGFGDPRAWLGAAALLALLGLGLASLRKPRTRELGLGILTILGFGFVTSNIPFATGTIFGERLLFAPSLGFALVLAWVLRRWSALGLRIGAAAWLGTSLLVFGSRVPIWKDNATLFAHDAERQPRSARLQLAASDFASDDDKRRLIERALEAWPEYPNALIALGNLEMRSNRNEIGRKHLYRAMTLPQFDETRDGFDVRWNLLGSELATGAVERAKDLIAALVAKHRQRFAAHFAGIESITGFLAKRGQQRRVRAIWTMLAEHPSLPKAARAEARRRAGQ